MSYMINILCKKCGNTDKVSSSVRKDKFLQGYIDREIPYLCGKCWTNNYDKTNHHDKNIRKQRCRCKNCFYYKEKKGTCLILNLCTLKEKIEKHDRIISANHLCGEWTSMRLKHGNTKNRSSNNFIKVESRFELLIL